TGARTSSSRSRPSWSARASSRSGDGTPSWTTCSATTARGSTGDRPSGDPRRALAARPPSAGRSREAAALPRSRGRAARPLASISDVAHTRTSTPGVLAVVCASSGPMVGIPDEPLRRRRGMRDMAKTYKQIMDEARKAVPEVSPDQVKKSLADGKPPLLLDVREKEEVRQGYVPGAISVPRGFLEMQIEDN